MSTVISLLLSPARFLQALPYPYGRCAVASLCSDTRSLILDDEVMAVCFCRAVIQFWTKRKSRRTDNTNCERQCPFRSVLQPIMGCACVLNLCNDLKNVVQNHSIFNANKKQGFPLHLYYIDFFKFVNRLPKICSIQYTKENV